MAQIPVEQAAIPSPVLAQMQAILAKDAQADRIALVWPEPIVPAESVRQILLHDTDVPLGPETELFLYLAALPAARRAGAGHGPGGAGGLRPARPAAPAGRPPRPGAAPGAGSPPGTGLAGLRPGAGGLRHREVRGPSQAPAQDRCCAGIGSWSVGAGNACCPGCAQQTLPAVVSELPVIDLAADGREDHAVLCRSAGSACSR